MSKVTFWNYTLCDVHLRIDGVEETLPSGYFIKVDSKCSIEYISGVDQNCNSVGDYIDEIVYSGDVAILAKYNNSDYFYGIDSDNNVVRYLPVEQILTIISSGDAPNVSNVSTIKYPRRLIEYGPMFNVQKANISKSNNTSSDNTLWIISIIMSIVVILMAVGVVVFLNIHKKTY